MRRVSTGVGLSLSVATAKAKPPLDKRACPLYTVPTNRKDTSMMGFRVTLRNQKTGEIVQRHVSCSYDAMSVVEEIAKRQMTVPANWCAIKCVRVDDAPTPAVEVVPMRAGDPCVVGKFYVVNEASNTITAGPFNTAGEAVEHRVASNQHVARECA